MRLQAMRDGAVTLAPRNDLDGNPASGELKEYEIVIKRISKSNGGLEDRTLFDETLVSNKESRS